MSTPDLEVTTDDNSVSYYPGGSSGGYAENSQEPMYAVSEEPLGRNQGPGIMAVALFLVFLGLFAIIAVYTQAGPGEQGPSNLARVLTLICALVLSGTGVHLGINGVPERPESDEEERATKVSLGAMGLGGLLGVVMLNVDSGALRYYSILMSVILFIYGYVTLLKPKE